MTRNTYRTAQGKIVDLGALQLQNEHVRAVGNMNVNARGDLIDPHNRPIASRNTQVNRQYNREVGTNTSKTPVNTPPPMNRRTPIENIKDVAPPPEDFDDDFDKSVIEKGKK